MIARAGELGAVTISTNMAGRGTDIQLGPGVAELGGLHVIGTNRHESRRIDNQLRGRAGRQGDPGSSEFFVSLQDDLLLKVSAAEDARTLRMFSASPRGRTSKSGAFCRNTRASIEGQRQKIQQRRQAILTGETALFLRIRAPGFAPHHRRPVGGLSGHHHRPARGRPVAFLGRPRPAARVSDVGSFAVYPAGRAA